MIVLMPLIKAVHRGVKIYRNHEAARQSELYVPSKTHPVTEFAPR